MNFLERACRLRWAVVTSASRRHTENTICDSTSSETKINWLQNECAEYAIPSMIWYSQRKMNTIMARHFSSAWMRGFAWPVSCIDNRRDSRIAAQVTHRRPTVHMPAHETFTLIITTWIRRRDDAFRMGKKNVPKKNAHILERDDETSSRQRKNEALMAKNEQKKRKHDEN